MIGLCCDDQAHDLEVANARAAELRSAVQAAEHRAAEAVASSAARDARTPLPPPPPSVPLAEAQKMQQRITELESDLARERSLVVHAKEVIDHHEQSKRRRRREPRDSAPPPAAARRHGSAGPAPEDLERLRELERSLAALQREQDAAEAEARQLWDAERVAKDHLEHLDRIEADVFAKVSQSPKRGGEGRPPPPSRFFADAAPRQGSDDDEEEESEEAAEEEEGFRESSGPDEEESDADEEAPPASDPPSSSDDDSGGAWPAPKAEASDGDDDAGAAATKPRDLMSRLRERMQQREVARRAEEDVSSVDSDSS